MLTANERIGRLEEQILLLRAAIRAAGALPIVALETALDQMVDSQLLPAATRTEIFGRLRSEIDAFAIASEDLRDGARSAIPRYPTAADVERQRAVMRDFAKLERETLQPRFSKRAADPVPGSRKAEPEPD